MPDMSKRLIEDIGYKSPKSTLRSILDANHPSHFPHGNAVFYGPRQVIVNRLRVK
jgi:hypothetical protein